MKFCVFSDSHNHTEHMLLALGQERPDAMLFLGDGERDLAAVFKRFPNLPVYAVQGNCDPIIGLVLAFSRIYLTDLPCARQ